MSTLIQEIPLSNSFPPPATCAALDAAMRAMSSGCPMRLSGVPAITAML